MDITINLTKLEKLELTPTLFTYLATLYYKEPYKLTDDSEKEVMEHILQERGYLKILPDNEILLRESCNKLFDDVTKWIDEWREIFTKGIKSGNRPVKGDKAGVLKKMKTFLKENPTINKEQIFEATRQYVFELSLKSYQFMLCADYFINKNNSSVLGAMIEEIADKGSTLEAIKQGGGSWHTEI